MRALLAIGLALLLTACGGGDVSDDQLVLFGSRACEESFPGAFTSACPVQLNVAGTETISVEITGYLVSTVNESDSTVQVQRRVSIQVSGQTADVRTLSLGLPPGMGDTLLFTLRADVPAEGLPGGPITVGISSTPLLGVSAVSGLVVTATAR